MSPRVRGPFIRGTILWILAMLWLLASYLVQDRPPSPWDAAFRSAVSWVGAGMVLVVSGIVVAGWIMFIRTRR